MKLAKGAALAAALLVISVGGTACKKKDAGKKQDPAAKTEGSGSASASGSGSAAATTEKKKDPLMGMKGAMASANVGGKAGAVGGMGLGGGGMGIGAKLGGLFGGGAKEAAAAPAPGAEPTEVHKTGKGGPDPDDEKIEAGDEEPAEHVAVKFPPPGQAGGDCAAVTDRLMIVLTQMMQGEMGELTEEQKGAAAKEVEAQMTEMRTQLLTMCTDQKWPQELKDCALTAMSEEDLDGCDKYVPEGMDDGDSDDGDGDGDYEPGEDYPAEPAKPVPAWTGGDDCQAVGDRMIQLATAQMGAEAEGEGAAEMAASLKEAAAELVTMCTDGKWPDDVRKCVLAAPTIDDAGECLSKIEM
jgi:hypothetical protein